MVMVKSYRPYLPDQEFLLPPSLREWLPEHHLVYFVSDVVDNLNLSALDAVYGDEPRGQPPYDPRRRTSAPSQIFASSTWRRWQGCLKR
jgi:transposase